MADVIDIASSRARLADLKEARALRRAQAIAAAALAEHLPALAEYERPRWPGGIDDLEF